MLPISTSTIPSPSPRDQHPHFSEDDEEGSSEGVSNPRKQRRPQRVRGYIRKGPCVGMGGVREANERSYPICPVHHRTQPNCNTRHCVLDCTTLGLGGANLAAGASLAAGRTHTAERAAGRQKRSGGQDGVRGEEQGGKGLEVDKPKVMI